MWSAMPKTTPRHTKIVKSPLDDLLHAADIDRAELVRRLNVHPNSVANWGSARTKIPGPVIAYLKLLADVRKLGR